MAKSGETLFRVHPARPPSGMAARRARGSRSSLIFLLAVGLCGCNRPSRGDAPAADPPAPPSLAEIEEARALESLTNGYPDRPSCMAACGKGRCLPAFSTGFYCRIPCGRDGDCPQGFVCLCGTRERSGGFITTVISHLSPMFVCALRSTLPPERTRPPRRR
jgi:hypothetical protein